LRHNDRAITMEGRVAAGLLAMEMRVDEIFEQALITRAWREVFSRSNPLVFSSWTHNSAWTKPPMGWTTTTELSQVQRAKFDPKAVAYFFYKASVPMARIFNVSVQAMQLRLCELGLLSIDHSAQGSLVA
jgi:hypothetical protein